MRINNGSRRGRAIDTESQFVENFLSDIPAILNAKVLIAGLMKRWESWGISAWRCSDVRNHGGAVVNDVTCEERMCVREVAIDTDHTVVFVSVPFIRGDQISGTVIVVCSVRRSKQVEELLYARINSDGDASIRSRVAAATRITPRRQ